MVESIKIIWPEVFETGEVSYPDTWEGRGAACADGLSAWGLCMAGNTPPATFGAVMAKIALFLDVLSTHDSLMAYSQQWFKEQKEILDSGSSPERRN